MDMLLCLWTIVTVLLSYFDAASTYKVKLVVVNREAPDYEGITCWTCPNKTDNEACNDWAPDIMCPYGHTFCKTTHRINKLTGMSVFVDKQCVMPAACQEDVVGCHDTDVTGVQDCITCCNEDYCNEHVASNHTSAFTLSSFYGNSSANLKSSLLQLWILVLTVSTFLWSGV